MTDRAALETRLAELQSAQQTAKSWGAAVGARHEEIKGIERQLRAMDAVPRSSPGSAAVPSPVSRLRKGYSNQSRDGNHMVDLVDSISGHAIAKCVYEPYADEILAALRSPDVEGEAKALAKIVALAPETELNKTCGCTVCQMRRVAETALRSPDVAATPPSSKSHQNLLALWDAVAGGAEPRCRDCADFDGRCQGNGVPCDPQARALERVKRLHAAAQPSGDPLAGLAERLDRLCLTSTEDNRNFVLATESARNIVEIVREWIRSGAGARYSVPSTNRAFPTDPTDPRYKADGMGPVVASPDRNIP